MGVESALRAPAQVSRPAVSRRPVIIFALLAAGVLIARFAAVQRLWPWLAIAGACSATVLFMHWKQRGPRGLAPVLLSIAAITLSTCWASLREHRVDDRSLAAMVTNRDHLWQLEGRIGSPPTVKTPGRGSLGRYGYQEPITVFRFEVTAAIDADERRIALNGTALVRVNGSGYRWSVGDQLRVRGMLRSFPPAMNPGETDLAQIARAQGLAGLLDVATMDNALELRTQRDWRWQWRRWQSDVRTRAAGWIRQDLPETDETRRDALLAALMLGERGPGLDGLDKSFARVGLAHLLAISGMHLAILVLTGLILVRLFSWPPPVERLVIALLVAAYLFVVPAQIPVWRAGVMSLAFLGAGVLGRRLDHLNLWAISAIVLLLWRPSELFAPGAQLSFGVVLGLIVLTPHLRLKLFGEPRDAELLSPADDVFEQCKTAVAATLMAWLVATPLVAHVFGVICPLAPLATLPAMALTHIALTVGYLKALTAVLWPSVGVILGPILAIATDGLIGLVDRLDRLPLSSLPILQPGVLWTLATTAAAVWWMRRRVEAGASRWRRWAAPTALLILFGWLMRSYSPHWLDPTPPRSRVVMLAVGNGSCYLVESGGEAVMFDAGSGNYLGIGDSTIIPAVRRLGILRVPTLILSHGDVDHFAAAIEVMTELHTRRLLITTPMMNEATVDPLGPIALVVSEAERLGVQLIIADAGYEAHYGASHWQWLHPKSNAIYDISNEASMVIRVDLGPHRLLLCGDLQGQGVRDVMASADARTLQASIMELPHHGSWSELNASFVRLVDPEIVLQSTAGARLIGDRWSEALASRQRYVTAEHGATIVDLAADGSRRVRTHLREGDLNEPGQGPSR